MIIQFSLQNNSTLSDISRAMQTTYWSKM